eukprot:CAMPEP_0204537262 /NCGR_PEP_ID=MMETSP0661-20131031/15093_1 /ASSEMBLY_ACC=CAM_ASM_000606 /TAXON_ID=109239 /ORGANISM="Alexandrium margalefi, Strain AMGDE01CS-322" /LENGTH=123 /DNA_ID=CAMNT_0051543811 /DNA_START=1 /DNA_END=368 /DNA_ORIENTATION=-
MGKQLVTYSGKGHPPQRARLFKIAGLTITSVFGPILDASAVALADLSLVAPLNGLDIVWNACSAPFTLDERLSPSYALGAALVFLGSSLSSLFRGDEQAPETHTIEREREIFISWRFCVYIVV